MLTGAASTPLPLDARISISAVSDPGVDVTISATETERTALASDIGINEILALEARLSIRPWRRRGIMVVGTTEAQIVQTCVVTLDQFKSEICESVHETFWPNSEDARGADREIVIDATAEDQPEPFSGGEIDLGQIVRDTLATTIDPYARKPGGSLDELEAEGLLSGAEDKPIARPSPFAVLAKINSEELDGD